MNGFVPKAEYTCSRYCLFGIENRQIEAFKVWNLKQLRD